MLVGLECWLRPGQAVANHHPTPSNKGRRPYVLQLRRSRRATLWVDTVALRTVDIGPCVADRTVRDATAVPTLLQSVIGPICPPIGDYHRTYLSLGFRLSYLLQLESRGMSPAYDNVQPKYSVIYVPIKYDRPSFGI